MNVSEKYSVFSFLCKKQPSKKIMISRRLNVFFKRILFIYLFWEIRVEKLMLRNFTECGLPIYLKPINKSQDFFWVFFKCFWYFSRIVFGGCFPYLIASVKDIKRNWLILWSVYYYYGYCYCYVQKEGPFKIFKCSGW